MRTKINHDKLYKIQTHSFYDAVITVTETCYSHTETNPLTRQYLTSHLELPDLHWEEAVAVVPLHLEEDNLTEAEKIKVVLETVDALQKAYDSYPNGEITISWTMHRNGPLCPIYLGRDLPHINMNTEGE